MAAPGYWRLATTLGGDAPEVVEAVTNFLWEHGALGVVEEPAADGVRLAAFFPPTAASDDLAAGVRAYLAELMALDLPLAPGPVAVERVLEERWAEAWRAHFRPVAVGRRVLICPPWEEPAPAAAAGRVVLRIEPGRAFGTGSHGSTRTCLELLERVLARGAVPAALDVGCGSGILAIAAARLGVERVQAIDLDPDAVAATEANAARNGVAGRVHAVCAALEAWTGPAAPLVLANLLATAHRTLAGTLVAATAVPGRLVLGGLLADEVPAVVGEFARRGCVERDGAEHDGWSAVLLER
ncbi:MAG TPA: 50S ribosomal protein L11 methyltransferase [Methylomirabilota bacterium]|nr:50S ribosomal protein L11 methyltransferase [Methylomirabilota bacterium]